MTEWWQAPEWGKAHPMHFPDHRGGRMEVIVLPVKKEHGSKEQQPDDRVRVYAARR